jgi:aspartyl-tRNA(Asn)/glutamyl-tRNA(Gln) amidotransferase subunit A
VAAVAAGLVPFAIGSETSGSIITPAAYSGVTGLRPTYGRISRYGAMALSWTLDKLGPMTRSAEDAALVLATSAGRDPLDRTSRDKPYSSM